MPDKSFVEPNFYAAAGGRAMLNMGGGAGRRTSRTNAYDGICKIQKQRWNTIF